MNATHHGILAKEFAIGGDGDFLQLGVMLGLPCGVTVGLLHTGASQYKGSLYRVAHVVKITHHIGALTADDDNLAVTALHAGHIA